MWICLAHSTQSILDGYIMVDRHGRIYYSNILSGEACSKLAFFNKSEDTILVVCPFSQNRSYIRNSNKLFQIPCSPVLPYHLVVICRHTSRSTLYLDCYHYWMVIVLVFRQLLPIILCYISVYLLEIIFYMHADESSCI